MSASLVGSVGKATRVTSGTTIAGVFGQSATAGHLLVAVLDGACSTAAANSFTTPSGWTSLVGPVKNTTGAGSSQAITQAFYKVATGGDTVTFTFSMGATFGVDCTIFEISGANNTSPLGTSGTYSSSGSGTGTATVTFSQTTAAAPTAGSFAISCMVQEAASATLTWSETGSGWTSSQLYPTSGASVAHAQINYQASPSTGSTLNDAGHFSTDTTAYGAGLTFTIQEATTSSGSGQLPAMKPSGTVTVVNPPTLVQNILLANANNTTTWTKTGISTTGGNTLVLEFTAWMTGNNPVHLASVSDSAGNVWNYTTSAQNNGSAPAGGAYDSGNNLYAFTTIATCVDAAAITSITVTTSATVTGSGEGCVQEISGLPPQAAVPAAWSTNADVTGVTSYTVPAVAPESPFPVAVFTCTSGINSEFTAASNGFTVLTVGSDTIAAYRLAITAGAINTTLSGSPSSNVPSAVTLAIGTPEVYVVQNQPGSGGSPGTFSTGTTAGNSVLIIAGGYNSSSSVMSTSAPTLGGSTPSNAVHIFDAVAAYDSGAGEGQICAMWLLPNVAGGQTSYGLTITNGTFIELAALEIAGLGANPVVDVTAFFESLAAAGTSVQAGPTPPTSYSKGLAVAATASYNGYTGGPSQTYWTVTDNGSHQAYGWVPGVFPQGETYEWTQTTGGASCAGLVYLVPTPQAKIATFQDAFGTNDLTANWSGTVGTVAVSGGQCSIQCDTSYSSRLGPSTLSYDLTNNSVYLELTPYQATSAQTMLNLADAYGDVIQFGYVGGVLEAYLDIPSSTKLATIGSVTYNPTAHAWIRVREISGTLYFDVAPDGAAWTNLWSSSEPFDLSSVTAAVFAGDYGSDPTGTSYVDNFNVAPATGITVTATQSGSAKYAGTALAVKVVVGAAATQNGATATSDTITVPELAITPTVTGSWIYGALNSDISGEPQYVPAANTVFYLNQPDTTNECVYGFFRSAGQMTAGTPVTIGGSGPSEPSGSYFASLAEILPASGQVLQEDSSSPNPVFTITAEAVTTAQFNPPGGSLLVAMVSTDTTGGGDDSIVMSNSGTALSWTQLVVDPTLGIAGIFIALVPITSTGSLGLPALAPSGTGTSTGGGGVTSTGSLGLPPLTPSATAAETISSTGSLGLPALKPSGTESETISSTGSLGLPALGLSGTESETIGSTGSLGLPALGLSGTGSAFSGVTSTGSLGLPALGLSGTATETGSNITSTGSLGLPALQPTGLEAETVGSTGSLGLPALAPSGTATETIGSVGSLGLPALKPSGSGSETIASTGSLGLPALKPSGTGVAATNITSTGSLGLPALMPGASGTTQAAVGSFISSIPSQVAGIVSPPGAAPGPGGGGGTASPGAGAGWEIVVRSYADFDTVLCVIPDSLLLGIQFTKQMDDLGSGTVTLSQDSTWWDNVPLGDGNAAEEILDYECLWQVVQDGVVRFEFLGETVTEQLIDPSEQRIATITGPGTIAVLKWAMCAPIGFPNIVLKLDGIEDSFDEIGENGQGVIDTNIWNSISPANQVYITPVDGAYNYPGGAGYALSSLYPSGSVTLGATPATTFFGATPYDATDTLISAQVTPIGLNNSTGDYSLTGLDGSEITQFYVQSNKNPDYYAMIGLTSTAFYCQSAGPTGTFTKNLASYDPTNNAYWQITEQGGSGGGSGTFYFWTSPDGENWTQQWQFVHTWDATDCVFYFAATYDVANSQSAQLTNLNSNVSAPSFQGDLYLGYPIMGIWYDQWGKAQARGTIPFTTTSMSPDADSYGNPWTDVQNVQTVNGTDLYSFLQSCTSILNADYVMQPGFVLEVGQPTEGAISLGVQRQAQIIFREGRDCLSKQRVRQRNQIQNVIGAQNQDGHEISATDGTSVTSWGQREAWFQTGAQVDPESMEIAAAAAAAANADEIESETLTITPNLSGKTVFKNFDVGDWVGVEQPDFSVEADRVTAIAVQVDGDGNETHELTLMTYVQWVEQQLTFISNKVGGAFVNAPGLTPVAPSKYGTGQVPTYFTPAQGLATLADVIGGATSGTPASAAPLVYNPATGLWQPAGSVNPATGEPMAMSIANGSGGVTVGPTGTVVSSTGLISAPDGGGAPPIASSVAQGPTGTVTVIDGVTRITVGIQGDGTVTTVETNGPAPAAPDTPSVTGIVDGLAVTWDGFLAAAPPLSDFLQVQVHLSATNGFTPSSATLQGTMVTGGTFNVANLTPGTTYYVVLLALNRSLAVSTPSTQASGVAGYVSASSIQSLNASLIGNLGVLNANPYFWGGDGTGWSGFDGTFAVTNTPAAGAPYTYAGVFTSNGTAGGAMEESGQKFPAVVNTQYQIVAWVYSSTTSLNIGFDWTLNGTYVSTTTTSVTIPASTWTQVTTVVTSPVSGINGGYPRIGPTTASSGLVVQAQAILALPQVPGVLIQAGTITAAQIAAGVVVAGIVNGTLIEGAQFVGYGTTGEVLLYTGTPALGNLNTSVSPSSGTDSDGNFYPAGVASLQPSGGATPYIVAQLFDGSVNVGSLAAVNFSGGRTPAGMTGAAADGSLTLTSGGQSGTDFPATFYMQSAQASPGGATGHPDGLIVATSPMQLLQTAPPSAVTGAAQIYSDTAGAPAAITGNGAGFAGTMALSQTDATVYLNNNLSGAKQFSGVYTIPAGDLHQGTKYTIEIVFDATMEGNVLELGLSIDGSTSFTVNDQLSGSIVSAGSTVNGVFRVTLMCIATGNGTGSSGTILAYTDGSVNAASTPTTFANSGGMAGNHAEVTPFNTTISHTIRVNSQWAASNASQTTSSYGNECVRTGQ